MALSYEYSIGSVRAKENLLLTRNDVEHMLGCNNTSELCRFLSDKGLGDSNDVDEILENRTKELWKYLKSVAPDFEIFSVFLYTNDIHNLKAVLKGTMADKSYKNLLLEPYTTEPDTIIDAVENRNFSELPDWLAEPAGRAYEILAHTSDARLCDAIIDRAAMEQTLKRARGLSSEFLLEYFKTTVFYNNIKIAIRAARTGTDRAFLNEAFCEVEGFEQKEISDAAIKGYDVLLDCISRLSAYGCRAACEQYKISPTAFERFVDDRLLSIAKDCCKRSAEGADPLLGYFIGCEAENKVIRIIANGLRTDSDREVIRERLREIYG